MNTLEMRKKNTANAFAMLKAGGQAVASDYTQVVLDFWLIDKRNTHMLSNWLEQAKRFPRICAAARKLMPMYCGVKVSKAKDGWKVENLDLSKKQKAKLMLECRKLEAMELTSLLNHPNIKVEVELEWSKEKPMATFKRTISDMIKHGVSVKELQAELNATAFAMEKAVKDNVVELPVAANA